MNILWTNGLQLEISKLLEGVTEQLPMEIDFMLLVDQALGEYLKVILHVWYLIQHLVQLKSGQKMLKMIQST